MLPGALPLLGLIILLVFVGFRRRGLRLLDHAVVRAHGFDGLAFLIEVGVLLDLLGILQHRVGGLIVLVSEQELVEPDHVGFQSGRNDACALLGDVGVASGPGEACGVRNVISGNALGHPHQIRKGDVDGYHGEAVHKDIVQHRKVRRLGLFEAGLDDLPLAFGTGKIRIHEAEPRIGHCLDAVQMLWAGMGQLYGADAGGLYRLRDVGVDIIKFRRRDVDIVHASQDVDAVGHRFPVKGDVVGHVQVQVLVQSSDGLLRSAQGISLVDLVVLVPLADIQVGIPENGHQLDVSRILIDAGQHDDVGIQALSYGAVPAVHAEDIEIPVSFHLLFLFDLSGRVYRIFQHVTALPAVFSSRGAFLPELPPCLRFPCAPWPLVSLLGSMA